MTYFGNSLSDFGSRVVERARSGLSVRRVGRLTSTADASVKPGEDHRYRLTIFRTLLRRAVGAMPPFWRETVAELCLRRAGAPGPAAEHVVQYLLSDAMAKGKPHATREATVAKGADNFYSRQYRQYFNATMGAFAMTAKMAALAAGDKPRGGLWRRRRGVRAAMAEEVDGAPPVIVLDHQTAATPLFLPQPQDAREARALHRWLAAKGAMPASYRRLADGEEMRCAEHGVRARRRAAVASMIVLADAALRSGKLAILALHPYDADAMGLHVTLFGVEAMTADALERDYGLGDGALDLWRRAAARRDAVLMFLAGGAEEVFTQCSQNLFVKRPRPGAEAPRRACWPHAWSPALPLERLLSAQFEILQATVSASGLPGVSPRNGDLGMAGFVARRGGRTLVLIPYFVGNAVHGHAAKLWSNPHATLIVWDDHSALAAVTISGPARVVSHRTVADRFPDIAAKIGARRRRSGATAEDPEYWFEQEVADIAQRDEPIAANWLDPARPTCSIHAGGRALHGKKPAYFAAETLPPYDTAWQHEREAAGRPADPSGVARRYWEWESAPALQERLAHLERLGV